MKEEASKESIGQLDQHYEDSVRPYETIIATIAIHNAQLHPLQEKYRLLKERYEALKETVHPTEQDEERRKEKLRELRKEQNRFIEEAITEHQQDFNEQYRRKRLQRLQEISLKCQQVSMMQPHRTSYNIFFNLEQGVLKEVMHQLGQTGEDELKNELGSWLTAYNNAIGANK